MSQKIAVISMYVPGSKMSLTCNVTTSNRYNIIRLIEDALRHEELAVEEISEENENAPEAGTSEANE